MYCDNDYNVLEIWILTPDYRRKCNFEYNDTSANKKKYIFNDKTVKEKEKEWRFKVKSQLKGSDCE